MLCIIIFYSIRSFKENINCKNRGSDDEKDDFKDNENADVAQNYDYGSSKDNLALKKLLNLIYHQMMIQMILKKFSNIVQLIEDNSEMLIAYHLRHSFRLVSFTEFIGDKPVSNVELESVSANEESKNILWKASKLLTNLTKKDGSYP